MEKICKRLKTLMPKIGVVGPVGTKLARAKTPRAKAKTSDKTKAANAPEGTFITTQTRQVALRGCLLDTVRPNALRFNLSRYAI
jgi:hypothetical protein